MYLRRYAIRFHQANNGFSFEEARASARSRLAVCRMKVLCAARSCVTVVLD